MIESNIIKIQYDQKADEYKCVNLGEVLIPQTQKVIIYNLLKELKKVQKISNWYQLASFFLVLCILAGMIVLMLQFWIGLILVIVFFFFYFMVFGKFIQLTKIQEANFEKIIIPFKIQLKGVYKIKKEYQQKGCFLNNQARTQLILIPVNVQVPLYGQNMQDYDDNNEPYESESSEDDEKEDESQSKNKKKAQKKQHAKKKQSIKIKHVS